MAVHLNHLAASRLLQERGRSITEVAAELDVDRANLSRMLAGRRNFPPEKITAFAELLGVNPYEILGPEDPRAAVIELARLLGVQPRDLEQVAS